MIKENIIEYITLCIGVFANNLGISNFHAYQYLKKYKAIRFLIDYYDIEHTLSIDEAIEDCVNICQRNGGSLKLNKIN